MIRKRSWLLIDLWARQPQDEAIFADITWTAFVGDAPSDVHNRIFRTVITARDAAFDFMAREIEAGRPPQGWQMDRVARDVIEKAGYAERFVHRLGHSLGREVHSNGVNLDDWETHDTRSLIQGLGVTIEPGIYLPEFGVRSEIDVFIGPDGPEITGEAQQEIVRMAV